MRRKEIWQVVSFALVLAILVGCCWLKPPDEYSVSERRPLAQAPTLTADSLLSGDFASDTESYVADQFPFRDAFRRIQAFVSEKLLGRNDHSGLYSYEGSVADMEYPLNADSIEHACDAFHRVYDAYLKDSDTRIYLSIIPDKNAFTAAPSGHLAIDYNTLYTSVQEQMPYAQYIAIDSLLSADDYYRTDPHWDQKALPDIAHALADGMHTTLPDTYTENTSDELFFGTYAGQYPFSVDGDTLTYLSNDTLDALTVYNHESSSYIPLYDHDAVSSKDPYAFFVGGSLSLITIDNPNAANDKELIVFRDSFASPLAPLLAQGYKRVVLVDIRYIPQVRLKDYISFQDQDVLFLYSTSVLNNSDAIK